MFAHVTLQFEKSISGPRGTLFAMEVWAVRAAALVPFVSLHRARQEDADAEEGIKGWLC